MAAEVTVLDIQKAVEGRLGAFGPIIFHPFINNLFLSRIRFDNDPDNIDENFQKKSWLLTELPDVIIRQFNEPFEFSAGRTETLKVPSLILGNLTDTEFMFENPKMEARPDFATQLAWISKTIQHEKADLFINGDPRLNPDEIFGLRAIAEIFELMGAESVISMDDTSGSGPLSYSALQRAIERIEPQRNLVMVAPADMRVVFSNGARDGSIINIEYTQDEFGRPQMTFNGLPVLDPGRDKLGNRILDFNEPDANSMNPFTGSIYVFANTVEDGGILPFIPTDVELFVPQRPANDPTRIVGGVQESFGTDFANTEALVHIEHIDFGNMVD